MWFVLSDSGDASFCFQSLDGFGHSKCASDAALLSLPIEVFPHGSRVPDLGETAGRGLRLGDP